MDYKKITIIGFIITCLAQLFIPTKMVIDQEEVLKSGMEYKFRTQPVDPNDPFRGKYITLSFTDNTFTSYEEENWVGQETAYVQLATDEEGFAHIINVSKTAPDIAEYVTAKVGYINTMENGQPELFIEYPFDRFYMEESKAKPAEEIYWEANRDTAQVTYALVNVKNGKGVLKDVVIDGKSIKEIVEEMSKK